MYLKFSLPSKLLIRVSLFCMFISMVGPLSFKAFGLIFSMLMAVLELIFRKVREGKFLSNIVVSAFAIMSRFVRALTWLRSTRLNLPWGGISTFKSVSDSKPDRSGKLAARGGLPLIILLPSKTRFVSGLPDKFIFLKSLETNRVRLLN